MKVKRYVGKTTQEAINKVRTELGQDAIIMSTRKIRKKGLLRWFKKPLVEVIAAVDDVIITQQDARKAIWRNAVDEEFGPKVKEKDKSLESLEQKVDAMGDMISKLMQGAYKVNEEGTLKFPPESASFYDMLVKNEVEEEFAERLINLALVVKKEKNVDFKAALEEVVLQTIGAAKPLEIKPGCKRIALFIGPTGVGKTTTLAKLAAIYSIQHGMKVGLITADTYRIAAVDQLKIYAEILGIPLSIIYSPNELKDAIDQHEDKDIILIDTAGKSIKDKEQEKEITQLLSFGKIDEVYLVIGSNTSYKGCASIIESYRFLPDYKLLFTKTDEIASYGIILNCCMLAQKPLSYFTTGQNVPDDIEIADPEKIKNLLMGSSEV